MEELYLTGNLEIHNILLDDGDQIVHIGTEASGSNYILSVTGKVELD